jgi:hypothetical protein
VPDHGPLLKDAPQQSVAREGDPAAECSHGAEFTVRNGTENPKRVTAVLLADPTSD